MAKTFKKSSAPRIANKAMTYDYMVALRMSGPTTPKQQSKKRLPSTDVTHLYKGKTVPLTNAKSSMVPSVRWFSVCPYSIKKHAPRYLSDKVKSDPSPATKSTTGMDFS